MLIQGREIRRVLIVDDDPDVRASYSDPVEDLGLKPVMFETIGTPQSFLEKVEPSDAIVCDYHLKKHSYSPCDGDVLVAECYKAGVPGMLCTAYTGVTIRRDCRRFIPSLLRFDSLHADAFIAAWEQCLAEIDGIFHPTRKPWRTLVQLEEVHDDPESLYAVVSSWDLHRRIRIDRESVPETIRELLQPGKELHFHAEVNIGASSREDLYFVSWEVEEEAPTFADVLLAIPQDDKDFERLRLSSRPVDL